MRLDSSYYLLDHHNNGKDRWTTGLKHFEIGCARLMVDMEGGRIVAGDHLVALVLELTVPPARISHRLEGVKYAYLTVVWIKRNGKWQMVL